MVERLFSPGVSATQPVRPTPPLERSGDPRLDTLQRTLATMLGSQVPVSVLARQGDGSFLVRVADTLARMQLPPDTQPGAQLTMKVLAASPQPSLQLDEATLHASPPSPGAQAGALAAVVAHSAGHTGARHDAAELSPAARLLAQVLSGASGDEATGPLTSKLTPLQGTAPLLPHGVPDPAQLAGRLEQAIAKSGLFYESHVAEWAEGKRSLDDLMQEPQARNAPGTPAADPAAARMINLQLASHEQAQLMWQGQLAPGLPVECRIAREGRRPAGDGSESEPTWRSGLRLRFAALGEVEASLSLRGRVLRIDLQAAPDVLAYLRDGAPRLEESLAAAGSELAALRFHGQESK